LLPAIAFAAPRATLSPAARRVLEFIESQRGLKTLSGQEENGNDLRAEQDKLLTLTGRRPAIRGWDVRTESLAPWDEARRSWLNERQLIEFSWHIGLPPGPDTFDQAKEPSDPNITSSQMTVIINDVLAPGTARNNDFMAKLDRVATQLALLQADDIPVLWRPFHEAEADFGRVGRSPFWWGKAGAAPFRELWRFMFDYFTRVRGLDNLIWVYSTLNNPVNGWPGDTRDWYPGDDVVDVVGSDIYRDGLTSDNNVAWSTWHDALVQLGRGRPVVLAENDLIPDPGEMKTRGSLFSWFLSWHTTYVGANPPEYLRTIYQHADVITADEMPNLRGPLVQLEAGTLSRGAVAASATAGFTGSGYVAAPAGGVIETSLGASPVAGPHVLSFFHAATDGDVTLTLSLNDRALPPLRLAAGGSTSWHSAEIPVLLAVGENTLRIITDAPVLLDSVTVAPAPVIVAMVVDAAAGRLVNLSTRARVGAGGVTAGFVLNGEGRREMLVRAAGPALAAFGLPGTLAHPELTLRDGGGRTLASNRGWSATNAAALRAASSAAGAFAFSDGSADAAVVATLDTGNFTAQVTSADSASGEALVEVYALGETGAQLANLSTRAAVSAGSAAPAAGFVIAGGPRTVLLRGLGPALAAFGVPGTLPDPVLSVRDARGIRLFGSDNWGSGLAADTTADIAARCGAFALAASSRDAALVATLPPGAYTVQLESANAAAGEGLIEIYLVP
jgi:hypothetical protein